MAKHNPHNAIGYMLSEKNRRQQAQLRQRPLPAGAAALVVLLSILAVCACFGGLAWQLHVLHTGG